MNQIRTFNRNLCKRIVSSAMLLGVAGWSAEELSRAQPKDSANMKSSMKSKTKSSARAARVNVEGQAALKRLLQGNARFVAEKLERPDQSAARRLEIANAQHPFAIVLTCSDSRVAPELVFDQGLGDLFVVRVAGNISDDAVLGSVEYAAEHLGARLVMVLGHERCGAVKAAIEESDEAHIATLARAIAPAVRAAKRQRGDLADNAMRQNVRLVVSQLRRDRPVLSGLVARRELSIIGGAYDLDTGRVSLLP